MSTSAQVSVVAQPCVSMPIRSHHSGERAVERIIPTRSNKLAATTLLMPILLYYCTNGYLIPRTYDPSFSAAAGPGSHLLIDRGSEVAVALCACCVALFNFKTVVNRLKRVPYLAYSGALAAISVVWASDRLHCAEASIALLSLLIITAYCCGRLRNNDLLRFLTYTGLVAFILSGLLVILSPDIGIEVGQSDAWRGLFGQKNNCGAFAGLFVFSALGYKGLSQIDRCARFLCLTLGIIFIVMSQSRTGWLLLAVGVAITFMVRFLKRFNSREAFVLAFSLLTAVAVAVILLCTHLGAVLLALGKDPTLTQRTIIWRVVWQAVMTHPLLGYGFNSFWHGLQSESANVLLVTGWVETQAQCGYLDLWLQLGAVGVILFGLALLQACNNFRRFWSQGSSRHLAWCATVILTTLLYNIGESSLLAPKNASWFFFVIACMSAAAGAEPDTSISSDAVKSGSEALRHV